MDADENGGVISGFVESRTGVLAASWAQVQGTLSESFDADFTGSSTVEFSGSLIGAAQVYAWSMWEPAIYATGSSAAKAEVWLTGFLYDSTAAQVVGYFDYPGTAPGLYWRGESTSLALLTEGIWATNEIVVFGTDTDTPAEYSFSGQADLIAGHTYSATVVLRMNAISDAVYVARANAFVDLHTIPAHSIFLWGDDTGVEGLFPTDTWPSQDIFGAFTLDSITVTSVLNAILADTTTDESVYQSGEDVTVTTVLEDEFADLVTGANVDYKLLDQANGTVLAGQCSEVASGTYQVTFGAGSLSGAGNYTVEVTATKDGYSPSASSASFTITLAPQVGHDVGVTGVSWDSSSAINTVTGDMHLTPGQDIVANGVRIKNYGDYREDSFPLFMELSPVSGGQTRQSNVRRPSLNASQEALHQEGLLINTADLPEDLYELTVKTSLAGDADAANDAMSWEIVLGNPAPVADIQADRELPYATYDWYCRQYLGTSPTAPEVAIGSSVYRLSAAYVDNEQITIYDRGSSLGTFSLADPPKSFYGGELIVFPTGSAWLPGSPDQWLINFEVGVKNDQYAQDTPMQVIFAYPGSEDDVRNVPERYRARFDFALPALGGACTEARLVGWGPRLTWSELQGYVKKWVTTDAPSRGYTADGIYGGSLRLANNRGRGTQNDYYVLVAKSAIPDETYNLGIIQLTNTTRQQNAVTRIGVAHSVRVTVQHYRDLAAGTVSVTPTSPTAGDAVTLELTVANDGDVPVANVPVSIAIVGPAGYNIVLDGIASNVPWQGQQVVTFDWDTAGLASGNYTATAHVFLPDDQDTSNQSVSIPITLHPPAPPPALQTQVILGDTVYDQGEAVGVDVTVQNPQGQATDATLYWELRRGGEVVKNGTATTGGGAWHVDDLGAPSVAGAYELTVLANAVGFSDGQAAVTFTIRDSIPPSEAVLVYPAAGQALSTAMPTLDWFDSIDASTGVQGYEVFLDGIVYTVADSAFTPSTALVEGNHVWKIRPKDGSTPVNWGEWSQDRTFVVDLTPPELAGHVVGLPGEPQRSHIGSLSIELAESPAWAS